jgi:uncharacterized protein YukE
VGTGAKSPSALAPFAHNWVGGDIHGLSAYAGTLYGYVPRLSDVATALDKKVSQIVGDAGWKGSAAAAFTKAWQHDATGATALAVMVSAAGDVVNTLAVNLASVESALEAAADTTTAHGVPVGAGGQPPQECFADATKESWRVSYQSFWNQSMLLAATARSQAAAALAQLGTAATEGGGDAGLGNGDYTALFDTLAGFFGAQTRYRAYVEGKLPGLKKSISKAVTDAREEARQADGRFGPWSDEGRQNFGDAKSTLSSVQDDLAAAEKTENPFTKAWGFSPSDISSVGTKLEGLDGTGGGLARFAGDIPFVDVAAAGASTYFGAQDDMAAGVPAYVAYPGEAGGNVAAIAAGGWVGGLAAGGAAAGLGALGVSGVGLTLAAGGAGVLAGGVVAYGVGDFAHNLIQENWGADISKHGVILGIGDGIGDSAVKTGQDFVKVGSGIAHGVEHAWDSIF